MLFRQLFDLATSTYTYLIADLKTKEAVLVDPVFEQVDRDWSLIQELGLALKYCLDTHVHADHITGAGRLRELSGCRTILPENAHVSCVDHFIANGESVEVGTIPIQAIATLGHTDSHMSYLVNGTHLLTGDSLLIRGCGRTDFQSGDAGILYDHVLNRLFTLPDETWVYPGHDYRGFTVSTIGEERQFNARLHGHNRQAFIELMQNLHLPNPQNIAIAVPANQNCGQLTA